MSEVIVRLASAFVSLCEAGDVSYLVWKREIRCNIEECKERGGDIVHEFADEVEKLERRREEWQNSLDDFRRKHRVLNYFSVKQILYLQKEMLRLEKKEIDCDRLPVQVFTLLKYIDIHVDNQKIKNALFLSAAMDTAPVNNTWADFKSDHANFNFFSLDDLKGFVDTLENEHFIERNVAMASLIRVPQYTVSKGESNYSQYLGKSQYKIDGRKDRQK